MAPRPPVSTYPLYRRVIAFPLYLLMLFVGQVVDRLFDGLAWAGVKLEHGARQHVFYPLVTLRRWIIGAPTWHRGDVWDLGLQPFTARMRAQADADPTVGLIKCVCDNPKCEMRTPRYVPQPKDVPIMSIQGALKSAISKAERDVQAMLDAEVERVRSQNAANLPIEK